MCAASSFAVVQPATFWSVVLQAKWLNVVHASAMSLTLQMLCCAAGLCSILAGAHRVSTTPDYRLLSLRGSEEWDSVVRQALSLRQGRPRQLVRITGPHPPPMGWYGGTVVRPLRHRQRSEGLSQPVSVGGYGPVVLAGCWGCPRLRGDACLPNESLSPGQVNVAAAAG